jgi:Glycosyl hydrolases family 38 C-terminal domain
LGLAVYQLVVGAAPLTTVLSIVTLSPQRSSADIRQATYFIAETLLDFSRGFTLQGSRVALTIEADGRLKSVTMSPSDQSPLTVAVELDFYTYGSRSESDSNSGAYLFMPSGPATRYQSPRQVIIVQGPLYEECIVELSNVRHSLRVYRSSADYSSAISINNLIKMEQLDALLSLMTLLKPNFLLAIYHCIRQQSR